MQRVIGYWEWDAEQRTLRRHDGVSVRFAGIDPDAPAYGVRKWMRFDVTVAEGSLTIPVEQRLAGRDSNYRGLWYRADFRRLRPDHPLWASAERIIGDALACWPRGQLIDALPTGVGIHGGYLGGSFREDFHRLYLPSFVGTAAFSSNLNSRPAFQGEWGWRQPQPGKAPDLRAAAKQGFDAFRAAARRAGEVHPSLVNGEQLVVLLPDEQGQVRLLYTDPTFGSFRFSYAARSRGEEERWSIFEFGSGTDVAPPDPTRSLFGRIDALLPKGSSPSRYPEKLKPQWQDRAYSAFHEALFSIPAGAIASDRMISPPVSVRSPSPWLRAGYLTQDCVTAIAPVGEELEAAFLDDPASGRPLVSPVGPAFDHRTGTLFAPDGSSLTLESASDWRGVAPGRLRFRCRSADLDWPVLVSRIDRRPPGTWDYRHQAMSRWSIDHCECLQAWRREGHEGFPDEHAWDRLRQFVEEALLSWGDGPAAGPAPQSLATKGGWYQGSWRGGELRRLLARPLDRDPLVRSDTWQPYSPSRCWQRADDTPATQADPVTDGYSSEAMHGPIVPFKKVVVGSPRARLFGNGFLLTSSREEFRRTNLVEYRDDDDHVRLGGLRSVLHTASMVRVVADLTQADENGRMAWPSPDAVETPGLRLWRRLRDAGEGGLRDGEIVEVRGGYFLDRFYSDAIRITALGAEIEDFDYRMFATSAGF